MREIRKNNYDGLQPSSISNNEKKESILSIKWHTVYLHTGWQASQISRSFNILW